MQSYGGARLAVAAHITSPHSVTAHRRHMGQPLRSCNTHLQRVKVPQRERERHEEGGARERTDRLRVHAAEVLKREAQDRARGALRELSRDVGALRGVRACLTKIKSNQMNFLVHESNPQHAMRSLNKSKAR
jgi:hypothetical protein